MGAWRDCAREVSAGGNRREAPAWFSAALLRSLPGSHRASRRVQDGAGMHAGWGHAGQPPPQKPPTTSSPLGPAAGSAPSTGHRAPGPVLCHARGPPGVRMVPGTLGTGWRGKCVFFFFFHDFHPPSVTHTHTHLAQVNDKAAVGTTAPPWLWQRRSTCGTCRGDIKAGDGDAASPCCGFCRFD